MRILITGGTGMLGRNLIEHPGSAGHVLLTPHRAALDLLDPRSIDAFLGDHPVDCIINCAALVGGIQAKLAEPYRFLADNLAIGCNIVAAARRYGVERFIGIGSSAMYPSGLGRPARPTDLLLGPMEPANESYGLAKLVACRMAELASRQSPSLLFKTLIPCNLFGRYDHFSPERSHIIPSIIRKVVEANRDDHDVEIWGDGSARREVMYVGDLADFIWSHVDALERLPDVLNVGTGTSHSVQDYYELSGAIAGFRGRFVHDLGRPAGRGAVTLDIADQAALGWSPPTSLEDGLRATLAFFTRRPI